MSKRLNKVLTGLLLSVLTLGGFTGLTGQAQPSPQPPGGAFGARQFFQPFFMAMRSGDLILLKDGGALSGTIQDNQVTVTLSSGQSQTLKRGDVALINFGDKSDNLVLTNGNVLSGTVQADGFAITLPNGTQTTVAKAKIAIATFKINLPASEPNQAERKALFKLFQGLRAQNIFQLFIKSLTSFDQVIFAKQQLWSGAILNQQFIFQSPTFGTLTFKASDVSSIELAPNTNADSKDFITLKTGDRLSGVLQDNIQFQPVGLTDSQGHPVTLTLKRGDVTQVVFRLPASAFGGGKGPGFGGGPGK